MTRRRWIADQWNETSAVLLHEQAAHLARVLRAHVGQEFDIVAGASVRRGRIVSIGEDAVRFSLHEQLPAVESLPLVLGLSIVRFDRMEWAIEKLTELGIRRIVPLITQRSEKHLVQAAAKRAERWRKIARESAQQSRRSDIPDIADPQTLPRWMQENPDGLRLLFSEHEHARSFRNCLEAVDNSPSSGAVSSALPPEKICAAIGPEGGWTEIELRLLQENGWQPVSLGPHILRAETAAIAVASVLSMWLR